MYAGEAVPHELLRDVCEPVAIALRGLVGGKRRPLADATQRATRAIGDAAGEVAALVLVERAARRIRRVLRDAGQLERLRVVERRVAAAMQHGDRMLRRNLIEIVPVERPLVLELRVVEEISLDPRSRRGLLRLRFELFDDA